MKKGLRIKIREKGILSLRKNMDKIAKIINESTRPTLRSRARWKDQVLKGMKKIGLEVARRRMLESERGGEDLL